MPRRGSCGGIRRGVWKQLDAPSLAAMAATLVYEPRRDEGTVSERYLPGAPYTPRCLRRIADDRAGFTLLAPLLAQPWGTKVWMIPLKAGPPRLTGRRLDGTGTFVGTASDGNVGSGVNFSQLGCWELEYEIAGDRVRFTVNVVGES